MEDKVMKKVMTSESHPLKVDFVIDLPTRGKLGASASLGPLSLSPRFVFVL
jgi:hypothetical protein